jgi:hypothetical protein
METARVSSLIRLQPGLMEKAKRRAKQENLSFNAYIERLLEQDSRLEWPTLPADFKVSEEILSFQIDGWKEPSKEELEADPKLAHILGYEN